MYAAAVSAYSVAYNGISIVFVTRGYGVRRIWGIGFRFVWVPGVLWVPVDLFGGLTQGRKPNGGSEVFYATTCIP